MYAITGGKADDTYESGIKYKTQLRDADNNAIENKVADSNGTDGQNARKNNTVGKHKHELGKFGNGQSHENMPPFYTLIWIMKL